MSQAAFNVAKADNNIMARPNACRRMARVLISKRTHQCAWMRLFHSSCHLIDKPYHQSRMTAITLLQGATIGTLAGLLIIILRHTVHPMPWMLIYIGAEAGNHGAQHFGVGKAELPVGNAAAVVETEKLGMSGEKLVRRHQNFKRMYAAIGVHPAILVLH